MKISTGVLAGVAVLAMAQAAEAAPPKPVGKYAFMGWSQCEARLAVTTSGPNVTSVSPAGSGLISIETGYVIFAPSSVGASTGNVTLTNRAMVEGGSLRVNTNGSAMKSTTEPNTTGTYSFTNTQFTITLPHEGALTFAMTHANAGKTVYLVRRDNPRCLNGITATRQKP